MSLVKTMLSKAEQTQLLCRFTVAVIQAVRLV